MNISELNDKLDLLGQNWEQFKKVNNERLGQLERKNASDPLTEMQLEKISNDIDEQKSKINSLEIALSRPKISNTEFKSCDDFQYKSAFNNYIKKGIEEQLNNLEMKRDILNCGDTSVSYGGYLITPNIQSIIAEKMQEQCIMRKICSVQEISSASLDVLDSSTITPSWLADNGTISDTSTTISTKTTITTHDLVAQPKVSQKLLDDAAIDLESWLADKLADDFACAEEEAFIIGTGSNQPKGILSYVGTTDSDIEALTSTVATGNFDEDDILDLYYSLDDKYANNAGFLMSRSAIKEIRKLKDSTSGHYLWNPALLAGQTDTLLGCPIYQSSYVPSVGSATKSIIFGDFKYYQIVDRIGIRILRDPFTAKPYIRFYTTKRVGGSVVNVDAFKVLTTKTA